MEASLVWFLPCSQTDSRYLAVGRSSRGWQDGGMVRSPSNNCSLPQWSVWESCSILADQIHEQGQVHPSPPSPGKRQFFQQGEMGGIKEPKLNHPWAMVSVQTPCSAPTASQFAFMFYCCLSLLMAGPSRPLDASSR